MTYILRKVNGDDIIRVIHHQKKSSLPPEKGTKIYVTTRNYNKTQVKSPSETRKATFCVTGRLHIQNQANSHSETRQASVSLEECTLTRKPTHTLEQERPHCHQKSAH